MKKKITFIIILAVFMMSAFVIPTTLHQNDVSAATKYIKIKTTTYEKYKKAYKKQPELKNTIAKQKKTIASQKTTIANQKVMIADKKTIIAEQKLEISDLNATIKDKKQTISWLWSTLEDLGYYYDYDQHQWLPAEGE